MTDEPATVQPKSNRGKLVPVLVVAMLILGEGVIVYFVVNALGSSPPETLAEGTESDVDAEGEAGGSQQGVLFEVELPQCRPSNKMSGKFISFQIRVIVLVSAAQLERAKQLVEAKKARIRDRINFVIRSAELKHLNEPGLETIKRRLKQEFGRVFGDESVVQEVLIAEMLQSGSGV